MTVQFIDRLKESVSTTGTGTWSLAGAVAAFQAFSNLGDGGQTYYLAQDENNNWETGLGTYTASGNTLSRDEVLGSSNGGALVDFATTPVVANDVPAAFLNQLPPVLVAGSNLEWYVSPTGSDSNPGTSAEPFATIQYACDVAALYDYQGLYSPTINVADGTYSNGSNYVPVVTLPLLINCPLGGALAGSSASTIVWDEAGYGVVFYAAGATSYWIIAGLTADTYSNAFSSNLAATIIVSGTVDVVDRTGGGQAYPIAALYEGAINLNGTLNVGMDLDDLAYGDQFGWVNFYGTINFTSSLSNTYGMFFFANFSGATLRGSFSGSSVTGPQIWLGTYSFLQSNVDRSAIPGTPSGNYLDYTSAFIGPTATDYQYETPASGDTITVGEEVRKLIIAPSGPLAALTVILPPNRVDGESWGAATTEVITALTLQTSDGSAIAALPSALAAGQAFAAEYLATPNSWFPSPGL